jgi:hypothetical protein
MKKLGDCIAVQPLDHRTTHHDYTKTNTEQNTPLEQRCCDSMNERMFQPTNIKDERRREPRGGGRGSIGLTTKEKGLRGSEGEREGEGEGEPFSH